MYLYNYHNIFAMHNKQVLHFSLSQRQSVQVIVTIYTCASLSSHIAYMQNQEACIWRHFLKQIKREHGKCRHFNLELFSVVGICNTLQHLLYLILYSVYCTPPGKVLWGPCFNLAPWLITKFGFRSSEAVWSCRAAFT